MSTALYSAVSGLLANQQRLDVIGNNIANVNTTGYRASRTLFQEQISQTIKGASAPSTTSGGTNAVQVGLGTQVSTIDINFSQGSLQTTGFESDLAIQGRGFFVLASVDGNAYFYSRDGSFSLNSEGELIDPATGLYVQGYMADGSGYIDTNLGITDLVIPVGGTSIVRATENVTMSGNLNSEAAAGDTVERSMAVYDSLGTQRDIRITFTKTANTNEWTWAASTTDPDVNTIAGTGTITFTADGAVSSVTATTVTVDFVDTNPSLPTDPFVFDVDFGAVTQLADLSDVVVQDQDGLARGVLESFSVADDGTINGVFSNGLTRVLGQVALANFSNEGGLVRYGQNLFIPSSNSGVAQIGVAKTGGRGELAGGVLESSNVDLGREFSELIITQRAYQANARTVTAADTLLQETVNLVR
ncbi:MAG: flagellar hook protein FlgE [Candidatus Hydrogenedentes bacterium]|nr:flagellar hook protein FlgE [Candidatus Hydrogenedentota bacterium]